jgi:2-polyprenyl-3-methyl-5-hydroxy-6-metoxy-1,4-benzoquinol methylase
MKDYLKKKLYFVPDRKNIFLSICDNKKVLYVGCGPPDIPWFFDEIRGIAEVAKEYVGLDIRSDYVKKLRVFGYNVLCGDAEKVNLREKFDVIMAMPLEHLSNQGIFLDNMKKHLKNNGLMVVCVPNISCLKYTLWQLFGKFHKLRTDPEHVLWHSEETLKEITERHGWKAKEIYYSYVIPRPSWKKVLASIASRFISPRFIGTTIVTVLEKKFIT